MARWVRRRKRTIAPWGFVRSGRRVVSDSTQTAPGVPHCPFERVPSPSPPLRRQRCPRRRSRAPPHPGRGRGPKVAIIVGPVGGMTDATATAPTASRMPPSRLARPSRRHTRRRRRGRRVRAAVDGANIVVYFGHGNGYPNPYTSGYEYTDRVNGLGLNRTTKNGDSDNWSTTMVYCGEKALLGTLTASDGAAQRSTARAVRSPGPRLHDGLRAGPLRPRVRRALPGERSDNDPEPGAPAREELLDPDAIARRRGLLRHGLRRCPRDRRRLLTQPDATYRGIFRAGDGYAASNLDMTGHPDVAGARSGCSGRSSLVSTSATPTTGTPSPATPAVGSVALLTDAIRTIPHYTAPP